jgi:hypothetical protein
VKKKKKKVTDVRKTIVVYYENQKKAINKHCRRNSGYNFKARAHEVTTYLI